MQHTDHGPPPRTTFVMVTPQGELSVEENTFQGMREMTFDGNPGGNEIVELPSLFPVVAYCGVPYEQTDPGRMNKVANGMVWELTAHPDRGTIDPERDDVLDAYAYDPLRVVKMRGPVAFYARLRSLTEAEIAALRHAHETAFGRLRSRGWI